MINIIKHPYLIIALIIAIVAYMSYYHIYLPNKVREYKIEKQVKEKTAKIVNQRRLEDAEQTEKEINSLDDAYLIDTDGLY